MPHFTFDGRPQFWYDHHHRQLSRALEDRSVFQGAQAKAEGSRPSSAPRRVPCAFGFGQPCCPCCCCAGSISSPRCRGRSQTWFRCCTCALHLPRSGRLVRGSIRGSTRNHSPPINSTSISQGSDSRPPENGDLDFAQHPSAPVRPVFARSSRSIRSCFGQQREPYKPRWFKSLRGYGI